MSPATSAIELTRQDGSASENALRERIRDGGFAIALSGGGHRATLVTLGALLAIVDRRLASKIIQVASVSGGSITNAFVAQRCQLHDKTEPGSLDGIAAELATTIIRRGVLTTGWIVGLFLISGVLGVVAGILLDTRFFFPIWLATVIGVLIGVVVALAALMLCGKVVEWLLDRRYFQHGRFARKWGQRERAPLSSLSDRIDHVICMTDLVLGLPVYASSQHGGMICRRLQAERVAGSEDYLFQTFDGKKISIAELVRASAAFPGIPPRRFKVPPDSQIDLVDKLPNTAFLADGGLWNNLGSQVIREDGFIGSHAAWERGVLRPYGKVPRGVPLLCVNGSGPLRPTQPWRFRFPLISQVRSLVQFLNILNANTVLPRVEAMRDSYKRQVEDSRVPWPADLIVDMSTTEETENHYQGGCWKQDDIRKNALAVKQWESGRVRLLQIAAGAPASEKTALLNKALSEEGKPVGAFPVRGIADMDDWDRLRMTPAWKQLVEKEGTGSIGAPTTLGRIEWSLARRLIARGYLNTYLVSLFLAPLADGDLDRLQSLPDRLDKIVGGKARVACV